MSCHWINSSLWSNTHNIFCFFAVISLGRISKTGTILRVERTTMVVITWTQTRDDYLDADRNELTRHTKTSCRIPNSPDNNLSFWNRTELRNISLCLLKQPDEHYCWIFIYCVLGLDQVEFLHAGFIISASLSIIFLSRKTRNIW